ncbi:MAG: DUF3857 domain-containing protein [Bacteroidales bacterium]|nr:DUF3857 domain-containing protein [Bacteroidales bacterium]
MKKILTLVTITILSITFAWAGEQPDAVYHKILRSYKLNEDGTVDMRFRKELQLFSLDAFYDTYGETFILYNTDFQTLTINEAYTIRKDGSRVETPANAFNPSLPYSCTDCDRFNSMREMVVTHTALEYDATIVLDYTIHTQTIFFPSLMEQIDLCEAAPIESYEIFVEVPEEFAVNYYKHYDESLEQFAQSTTDSNTTLLHWVFNNMPQKPAESYIDPNCMPFLLFTTVPNPLYLAEMLQNQNAFLHHDRKIFQDVLKEIVKEGDTPMQQVLAIRDYVANRIHTNDLNIRYLNYLVAAPYTVWQSNCGTPFEKDLLLKEMLQTAGFQCNFGFFFEEMMKDMQTAVQVKVDGKDYYISTAYTDNVPMDVRCAPNSFIMMNGEMVQTQDVPNVRVDLAADVSVALKPVVAMHKTEATQNTLLPAKESKVSATVSPLHNGYYQLYVRPSVNGIPIKAARLNSQRITPLFSPKVEEHYEYDLRLPAGARWVTQPYEYTKEYDFGKINIRYTIDGSTMHVVRELSVWENIIDLSQYKDFKAMMSLWDEQHDLIYTTNK